MGEDPIQDQIIVAGDWGLAVSSDNVYSPHRQAINYPDFGGHPTRAKGPKPVSDVVDAASELASEPEADNPSEPLESSTCQQGASKSPRNLQDTDGSFDVSGKGKGRATPASERQPFQKKAKTSQLQYCARCHERKSKPAVTGKRRNGNAIHKCPDCKLLRENGSEHAERPLGKKKVRWSVQPERQDVSTAGKEQPQPPKQDNGPPINPIPGKKELVAVPLKSYKEQHGGPECDTEPDDPNNPVLPHGTNPNVDQFGITTSRVNTIHQSPEALRQQGPVPETMAVVPQAVSYDEEGPPVSYDSATASAQYGGSSHLDRGLPPYSAAPATVNPALLDKSRNPGPDEEPRSVRSEPLPIDPDLLKVPWGQVHAYVASHHGLKPTPTDPMLTGQERVPVNPLPASTNGSNNYNDSRWASATS